MRTIARTLFVLGFIIIVAPAVGYAQATIAGVVRDTSGGVLPGVTVEAASPALIEKVRSSVTDDGGQYRIENLRPGIYSITFALQGFSTVKREQIELAGTFTATINVELRVGAVEETITVTGESPTVDVQGTVRQLVMDHEVIDAIPTARTDKNLALLIPAVSTGGVSQDVGGTEDYATSAFRVHGSRGSDQRVSVSGLSLGSGSQGGAETRALTNMSAMQEVTIDIGAADAEQSTGGVRINLVPKDGGNRFSGTAFWSYGSEALQGDNFTPELAAALGTPDALKRIWDFNPGFGGPIKRDRLWFHAAYRNVGNETYPAGSYNNRNANNPNAWTFEPDLSSRPFNHLEQWDGQVRLTWQTTPKIKTGLVWQEGYYCGCSVSVNALTAPEAAFHQPGQKQRNLIGDWTIPLTNRILIDAGALLRYQNTVRIVPPGTNPAMIAVTEQSLGNFRYRMVDTGSGVRPDVRYGPFVNIGYVRSAVSFITGSHALRAGFNLRSMTEVQWYGNVAAGAPQMSYRFNNGVPNQITLYAYPIAFNFNIDADHGLFIQDRWTIGRLTASFGLRYDYYKNSFPAMTVDPTPLLPQRNFSFPETDGIAWHDLAPKSGLAYDLFGDGKTALKFSLNKYVEGMGNTDPFFGSALNPAQRLSNVTTRSWTDDDKDFIPDCDLAAPGLNDECGAMANQNFGRQLGAAAYDPAVMSGWGLRPYNWELSAGVQQEVLPRLAVDATFFHRWFGNFYVTDNRAVSPSDFSAFSIAVPTTDPRLPTAGETLSGFNNLNPNRVGQVDNYITSASTYGKQTESWTGIDIGVTMRGGRGLLLQGGTSTGSTKTNTCEIRSALPETAPTNPFCDSATPYLTRIKFLAAYTVPRIDVQVSGTIQNVPGPAANANFVATNAMVSPTLGRVLSGGAANVTVPLVEPNSLYADRIHQVDLRVGKLVQVAGVRTMLSVDMFNALNSNAVLSVLDTFGGARPWLSPRSIMQARLIKFSAQIDF